MTRIHPTGWLIARKDDEDAPPHPHPVGSNHGDESGTSTRVKEEEERLDGHENKNAHSDDSMLI